MISVKTTDTRAISTLILACLSMVVLAITCANSGEAFANDESTTFQVLLSFPVHFTDGDEAPEDRHKRLKEIAAAVDSASASTRDRAALLTLARHESNLAAYVQEARCSDGPRGKLECDGGRATGLWQIHGEVPDDLAGQADLAIRLWRFGFSRCQGKTPDDYAGAFGSYGTGGKCSPTSQSAKRADYMRMIERKL